MMVGALKAVGACAKPLRKIRQATIPNLPVSNRFEPLLSASNADSNPAPAFTFQPKITQPKAMQPKAPQPKVMQPKAVSAAAQGTGCSEPVQPNGRGGPSKSALKNKKRHEKQRSRREAHKAVEVYSPAPFAQEMQDACCQDDASETSYYTSTDTSDSTPLATATPPATAATSLMDVACESEGGAVEASAGPFGLLGYDALVILMEQLHQECDVRALACTCKHLALMASDGLLWRLLFAKHFPRSSLCAASVDEWKHTYMLELSANADQLTCFHTKRAFGAVDDVRGRLEVFGLPLRFTVNPRTQEVDYIYSSMDTLAFSAYADDGVRRTVWNESFTHFLPLYLSPEHFEAALPLLKRTIRDLCAPSPRWRHAHGEFRPEMALDAIPKLLSTMVVLLCDKGVSSSDRLLDGYVQLNRLLLALAERFPSLRAAVTRRVQLFIKSEDARSKAAEPSLGVLVPLLALASGLRWSDLAGPLLRESFDRGVLWACRDHPELATADGCSAEERLLWGWEGRRVASRLLMFHHGFLQRLAKTSTRELDQFMGQPTPWLRASMRAHVAKVLAADSWPAFFASLNVPLPSKAQMNAWLVEAVANSERKGYHKKGMDFGRVQRSGVSALLRKGESVSARANISRVRVEEVWRFSGGTIYLDASCLCYGFDGHPLATVDYSQRRSVSGMVDSGEGVYGRGGGCAITHSGDVMSDHEGRHTITIELHRLSAKVESLYLTLSAWTTALNEIIRPEIRCFDPDDSSGEPLARYELDGKPTGDKTAVVMARVWRAKPGGRWNVTAIGELGMGRASDYAPIHEMIRGNIRTYSQKDS